MNNYKIGTVISLAIALVACPSDLFGQKKRPRGASQSAATNPADPGGHSAAGVEAAKNRDYEKAIAEFTKAIEAEPKDANYFNRPTAYRGATNWWKRSAISPRRSS